MRARDNPFRTERILQVRYQWPGFSWDELLRRAETLRYRAAIIGPPGSGKTTLLEDLAPRLRQRGFRPHLLRLSREQTSLPLDDVKDFFRRLTGQDLLLVDGAEQLNPLAWCRLRCRTRCRAGLIVTTHRGGRLPTLWECRTDTALLAAIAADLLGVGPAMTVEPANILFAKHQGNLREALREWYDWAAEDRLGRTAMAVPGLST
jgi:hypothetical protein